MSFSEVFDFERLIIFYGEMVTQHTNADASPVQAQHPHTWKPSTEFTGDNGTAGSQCS